MASATTTLFLKHSFDFQFPSLLYLSGLEALVCLQAQKSHSPQRRTNFESGGVVALLSEEASIKHQGEATKRSGRSCRERKRER